jgi:hypothetical protein
MFLTEKIEKSIKSRKPEKNNQKTKQAIRPNRHLKTMNQLEKRLAITEKSIKSRKPEKNNRKNQTSY